MERLTVTMQPMPSETRLLVMAGRHEAMRALLGPATSSHPRAAATLLEGISLWYQQALSVVLYADAEPSSSATQLFDNLGIGERTVHYNVDVALRAWTGQGRRIPGFGKFSDLRKLCLEGVSP